MIRLAAMMMMAAVPVAAQAPVPLAIPGVPNPAQARIDYMLKCQGCHQPDGAGNMVNTPPLAGTVARFLAVPGGRQFVARVPGVSMVDLDDVRLAQLLNWTLFRFDAGHVPAGFTPYTPAEIGALRRQPLRLDRVAVRAALMRHIEGTR
jgi:hypothetical protein